MKKIVIIILLDIFCQSAVMAQEQDVNSATIKYMERAELSMKNIKVPSDYQIVINELLGALVESPNHPFIIFNLGICYEGMGIIDVNSYYKAIEYYKQFLTLNPSETDRKNVLNRMKEIEYAIENAVGQQLTLDKLIGRWNLGGVSHPACMQNIEIFESDGYYFVKYLWFGTYFEKKNGLLPWPWDCPDDIIYNTTEIYFDNDTIIFTIDNFKSWKTNKGRHEHMVHMLTYTYKVFWYNGNLAGTSNCIEYYSATGNSDYKTVAAARRDGRGIVQSDCEGNCGMENIYFIKQW